MPASPLRYRAVFVSDFHLGAAACQTEHIQQFLDSVECDYLYLVGDIIDLWVSIKAGKWRQRHTSVIRTILGKSEYGCKVYYTPGNHDALFRKFNGASLGNILIDHSFTHITADGKRLLVVHGDLFDRSVTSLKPLAWSAAWCYEFLTVFLHWLHALRHPCGQERGRTRIKEKFKRILQYFSSFQEHITIDAKNKGYQGVVCGHIHKPKIEVHESGTTYFNSGDWMENCTVLVEHYDGRMELLWWDQLRRELDTLALPAYAVAEKPVSHEVVE